MAGILSKDTVMSHSTNGTAYTDLALLMEVPEIGGSAEKVDVTVLKDSVKKYINGIKDYGELEFKFLYDNSSETADYRVLSGYEQAGTDVKWKITLPDGTAFAFSGQVSVKLDAASVGAALTFTATIALSSDIDVTNPSGE